MPRKKNDSLFPPNTKKDNMHYVWHKWQNKFCDKNGKYLEKGYKMQEKAERFAKYYPDYITVVGVDDTVFASSILVLIEHKTITTYMGTTVVYIPQCTNEDPVEFFLYPNHRKNLIQVLKSLGEN